MVTKDLGMVTAYAYAVAGGYTGTEAEFTQLMADLAVVVDDFDNFSVNVTTLPAGSSATASYADGVLSLGIPKGDKGDKGNTGETGAPAGFGTVSATVDDNIGTPSVEVTASGADTAKNFAFAFHNLKGQKGDKGDTGEVSEAELAQAFADFSENGTVANAEQLTTDIRANDQTPYLFRTSGGSVDIGDREYINGIVGGTVAWNQLVRNGDFSQGDTPWAVANAIKSTITGGIRATAVSTGQFNINQYVGFKNGHVYLMSASANSYDVDASMGVSVSLQYNNQYKITGNQAVNDVYWIRKESADRNNIIFTAKANSASSYIELTKVEVFDLTQMFGSTIADYIYSLEQANAGAGVAFFKKLFPNMDAEYSYFEDPFDESTEVTKKLRDYQSGVLLSVEGVSAHDMVGFNQWDEEWEVGRISTLNGALLDGGGIRSKNFSPCFPSTVYYVSGTQQNKYIIYYDKNKNFINGEGASNDFATSSPSNARYFKVRVDGITSYSNNLCINLSWSGTRNGEYEPYEKHSYPLDSSKVMRGIFKLDAQNRLYADGDIYPPSGEFQRRYAIVDLGTLNWERNASYGMFTQNLINSIKKGSSSVTANIICDKYITAPWDTVYSGGTNSGLIGETNSGIVGISTTETDPSVFKSAMSGVYLVFELATPTTETADPYQQTQIVDDFGTEEWVLDSDAFPMPVGHNTDYPINLKAKVEMMPNSPSGDGDYIVRQTNGVNEYVSIANNATIQDILARLEALEG